MARKTASKLDPDKLTHNKWLSTYLQPTNPNLLAGVEWCIEHGFGTTGLDNDLPGYIIRSECSLYGRIGQGMLKFVVSLRGRVFGDGDLIWKASVCGSMDTQLDAALKLSGVCNRLYTGKEPCKALMQLVPVLRKLDKIGDKLKEAVGNATVEIMEIKQEGKI